MVEIRDEFAVVIIIAILLLGFIFIYPQLRDYIPGQEEGAEEAPETIGLDSEVVTPSEPEEEPEEIEEPEEPELGLEEQYIRDSTYLNKSHDYGLFETKLMRVGFYTHGTQIDFRADIWVKHVGTGVEDFAAEEGFIRKIPNIKYNVTSMNFNGTDIGPDEEREGYILFADVPLGFKGNVTLSIGTSVGYSTIFETITKLPHVYEISLD